MRSIFLRSIFALLLISSVANAQTSGNLTLKEAAQNAVLNNPEVLSHWHVLQASSGERDAAFGGYLPRLDLTAGTGKERRNDPTVKGDYSRNSSSLALSQMLYDGFATRNEVKRLDSVRLVRLFEFFDASESAAFEAARAYFDVLRYRKLVGLAEENYVQHRTVFQQTERRVNAKVARGVDLEQVSGRLALAEANLLTETANLHDTSARFQRVVGLLPTKNLPEPARLNKNIPADAISAIRIAQEHNPALLASIANVRASKSAKDTRNGAYQPRVDLRLRHDQGNNLGGVLGSSDVRVAEVVLSWNLFNGFTDVSRGRQFAEQLNTAKDLRDKTCRETRQTLLIAYNDIRKLTEQIAYLDQHQLSVEKAMNAYRQQFDIGQRTLLDLLDTENEVFQAKRALVNAEYDLGIAYVRTHAAAGTLLAALELSKIDTEPVPGFDTWAAGEDSSQQCPLEAVTIYTVDKSALNLRAEEVLKDAQLLNARERAMVEVLAPEGGTSEVITPTKSKSAAPISAVVAPVEVAQTAALVPPPATVAAPVSTSPVPTVVAAAKDVTVSRALKAWVAAWSNRDVGGYLNAYADTFTPSADISHEAWVEKRKSVIAGANKISVSIAGVKTTMREAGRAVTVFRQSYRSDSYRAITMKTLEWERIGDRWVITAETTSK